ncbi:MAG: hypothetical protein QXN59_03020 [Candidatus Micrarchaeaceae archaeon]
MMAVKLWEAIAALSFIGSLGAMLITFYYMQSASLVLGVSSGIALIASSYNISLNRTAISLASNTPIYRVGVYFTYLMLPIALAMFGIAVLWFFGLRRSRVSGLSMALLSGIFIALLTILKLNLYFSEPLILIVAGYTGAAMSLLGGAYAFAQRQQKHHQIRPIEINPSKPYANMLQIYDRVVGNLSGDIKVLDKNFDTASLSNLYRIISSGKDSIRSVFVLTSAERLGKAFERDYYDIKKEFEQYGIYLDIRVMSDSDSNEQHERFLADSNNAFKIPPLNIINRKSEHIIRMPPKEINRRFDEVFKRSTKAENFFSKANK